MARMKRFWQGFGLGAAAGAGAGIGLFVAARALRRAPDHRIVRIEKSVQIGKPVQQAFAAWSDLNCLPQLVPMLRRVHVDGEVSHWQVEINGRLKEFDAETIQFVPNQAIGWKSITGPKHTGRIYFSPLGDNTMVHVIMNYRPPGGIFSRLLNPIVGALDTAIDEALRDFKASLEGKGQVREFQATGTYGTQTSRFGGETGVNEPGGPVEWTRPTQAPATYSGEQELPPRWGASKE